MYDHVAPVHECTSKSSGNGAVCFYSETLPLKHPKEAQSYLACNIQLICYALNGVICDILHVIHKWYIIRIYMKGFLVSQSLDTRLKVLSLHARAPACAKVGESRKRWCNKPTQSDGFWAQQISLTFCGSAFLGVCQCLALWAPARVTLPGDQLGGVSSLDEVNASQNFHSEEVTDFNNEPW